MSMAESEGSKTTAAAASDRWGRANGGNNSLKGGSAHGSRERRGGTAAESSGRGTAGKKDQGAGTEPVWIRITQRQKESEPHAGTVMLGVVTGPVARVLSPYNGV